MIYKACALVRQNGFTDDVFTFWADLMSDQQDFFLRGQPTDGTLEERIAWIKQREISMCCNCEEGPERPRWFMKPRSCFMFYGMPDNGKPFRTLRTEERYQIWTNQDYELTESQG